MSDQEGLTSPSVCVLGAAGDTGNLGVTALLHATVAGIAERLPGARITVLDNGRGTRTMTLSGRDGDARVRCRGLWLSRRVHRSESLANVRVASRVAPWMNATARALLGADAVLDISAGDSFSDLYGPHRARMIMAPKQLVLSQRRPLILLPQTYGPFSAPSSWAAAREIVSRATLAWARDPDSYGALQALLGDAFDPHRHRAGVDVAFRLPVRPAPELLDDRLRSWLTPPRSAPVVGLNVSGLLYLHPSATREYGLAASYPDAIHGLIRHLLEDSDARLVLVPHVLGAPESDEEAAQAVLARIPGAWHHRVAIAPTTSDPTRTKWVIGQLDWFCGTRMHSTIAALSMGVPVAAVAYSLKTRGVFATCGLAGEVADARRLGDRELVAALVRSWERRGEVGETLRRHLPGVLDRADQQMTALTDRVLELAGSLPSPRR